MVNADTEFYQLMSLLPDNQIEMALTLDVDEDKRYWCDNFSLRKTYHAQEYKDRKMWLK